MDNLFHKVVKWAYERNIINGSDPKTQTIKLISEVGELSDSINKGTDCRDDIGDCLVVLTILAEQKGYTIKECLEFAYEDIKDRKGLMFNGCFIKESDDVFQQIKKNLELMNNET